MLRAPEVVVSRGKGKFAGANSKLQCTDLGFTWLYWDGGLSPLPKPRAGLWTNPFLYRYAAVKFHRTKMRILPDCLMAEVGTDHG